MGLNNFTIYVADDVGAIGSFGSVILNVACKPQPIERIRESLRLTHLLQRKQGKVGSFSVVEPPAIAPQPDPERDETNKMMLTSPLTAAALIIEGSGFRAAAARTVIAGYFIIKRPYAVKVLSQTTPGAVWLVEELGRHGVGGLDSVALDKALAQLRAAIPRC